MDWLHTYTYWIVLPFVMQVRNPIKFRGNLPITPLLLESPNRAIMLPASAYEYGTVHYSLDRKLVHLLIVTLGKSETYKETIKEKSTILPYSIHLLVHLLVPYWTVHYAPILRYSYEYPDYGTRTI